MTKKTKLTAEGVHLPREWFGDAEEVEIVVEAGRVVVQPVVEKPPLTEEQRKKDPIWQLGKNPTTIEGIDDASRNLDKYLYGKP